LPPINISLLVPVDGAIRVLQKAERGNIGTAAYALTPFKRRLHFPDGTTKDREFKAGEAIWMGAQNHVGENVGNTDTEALIVELKPPVPVGKGQKIR
jgi:hypothetical protein